MEYAKTAQTVQDLDGKTIASFAPREASLVKDVTLAKDTTDKINFDIEDFIDEPEIDISSIFGYSGDSDVVKKFLLIWVVKKSCNMFQIKREQFWLALLFVFCFFVLFTFLVMTFIKFILSHLS